MTFTVYNVVISKFYSKICIPKFMYTRLIKRNIELNLTYNYKIV